MVSCYFLYFGTLNGQNEGINQCNKDKTKKFFELPHIFRTNALPYPDTMVIMAVNTCFTGFAVLGPVLDWNFTLMAITIKIKH
jgi:hypothetical protein